MSISVPISVKTGRLPLSYEFTPSSYRAMLLQRLELYLTGDGIVLGDSAAAILPTRNKGAVFLPSTRSWWAWDDTTAQYLPIEIGFTNGTFGTTIAANPSANRTVTIPDSSGTAVLLTDVSIPKATVVLTSSAGTVSTIDANVSNNFILTLTENSTMPSLTNMASGSGTRIRIAIINDGTAYTVTWPTAGANEIKWPSSPSHTQPVATAGQPQALGIYTISEANVGLTPHLWGDPEVAGFNPPDTIDTGGTVPDAYIGTGTLPGKGVKPYNRP